MVEQSAEQNAIDNIINGTAEVASVIPAHIVEPTIVDTVQTTTAPDIILPVTADATPLQSIPIATSTVTEVETPAFNQSAWLKENFDVDNIDILKDKLKNTSSITFDNEVSEQLYKAIQAGKYKEVAEVLTKRDFAESVKDKSSEDLIKAHIKQTNPYFDADDIEEEYKDRYTVDELAFDDNKLKREQKKVKQRLEQDAEKAKEFFNNFAQDIKFPSIDNQQAQASAPILDMTSEEAKKALTFSSELNKNISDVNGISYEYNDENSKIKLQGQVSIPADRLNNIKTQLQGREELFIANRYVDAKGNFNSDLFASDVYFLTHKSDVVKAAVADASHQTRLAIYAKNKNYKGAASEPTGSIDDGKTATEWFDKLMGVPASKVDRYSAIFK